jgi:regulatory protein
MRLALRVKGHAEEAIDAALARLRQERLLDDAGLAARYARSRLEHQGLGPHRLRQGLRKKGVARAVAEAGIQAALGQVSEAGVIDGLARRYWKANARKSPEKRLRALWGFLLRRGFPATLILSRLKALWPRWQDALDGLEPVEVDPAGGETED